MEPVHADADDAGAVALPVVHGQCPGDSACHRVPGGDGATVRAQGRLTDGALGAAALVRADGALVGVIALVRAHRALVVTGGQQERG